VQPLRANAPEKPNKRNPGVGWHDWFGEGLISNTICNKPKYPKEVPAQLGLRRQTEPDGKPTRERYSWG
jgi:hypothetical protein